MTTRLEIAVLARYQLQRRPLTFDAVADTALISACPAPMKALSGDAIASVCSVPLKTNQAMAEKATAVIANVFIALPPKHRNTSLA